MNAIKIENYTHRENGMPWYLWNRKRSQIRSSDLDLDFFVLKTMTMTTTTTAMRDDDSDAEQFNIVFKIG